MSLRAHAETLLPRAALAAFIVVLGLSPAVGQSAGAGGARAARQEGRTQSADAGQSGEAAGGQTQTGGEPKASWRDAYAKKAGQAGGEADGENWREKRKKAPRSMGEFLARFWLLLLVGIIGISLYVWTKHVSGGIPPEPEGGSKLATPEEVEGVYGVAWGQGGHMLGVVVKAELTAWERMCEKATAFGEWIGALAARLNNKNAGKLS